MEDIERENYEPEREGETLIWVSTLEFKAKVEVDRMGTQSRTESKVVPKPSQPQAQKKFDKAVLFGGKHM